jgi:hypothetical protein
MLMVLSFRCQPIRWNELFPMIARQELTRSLDMGRTSFFLRLGALTNSPSLRPPNAHFLSQSLRLRDYDACILLPCTNAPLQRYAAGVGMMMGVRGRIATRGSQLQGIYSAEIVPYSAEDFWRTWWSRRYETSKLMTVSFARYSGTTGYFEITSPPSAAP